MKHYLTPSVEVVYLSNESQDVIMASSLNEVGIDFGELWGAPDQWRGKL